MDVHNLNTSAMHSSCILFGNDRTIAIQLLCNAEFHDRWWQQLLKAICLQQILISLAKIVGLNIGPPQYASAQQFPEDSTMAA